MDRPFLPTLRCLRCGRAALRDALWAWLMQPVTPDGGWVHFECRRCRPPELRRAGRRGDPRPWL